jgi:hypothetical protein
MRGLKRKIRLSCASAILLRVVRKIAYLIEKDRNMALVSDFTTTCVRTPHSQSKHSPSLIPPTLNSRFQQKWFVANSE